MPLSSLGDVGDTLTYDLKLPAWLPNWAETRVVIRIPSRQVWYAELGSRSLYNLSPHTFHRFSYPLSPSLIQALESSYDDLHFHIIVNGPAAGHHLVDRLRLDGDSEPPEPDGGVGGTAGDAGTGGAGTGGTGGGTTIPPPGETGPAMVSGTFDGRAIPIAHAFSVIRSSPLPQVGVVLASDSDACSLVQGAIDQPDDWFIHINVVRLDGSEDPIGPGTYDIGVAQAPFHAMAMISEVGAACEQALSQNHATSGHIELTEVTSSGAVGTYSVTFEDQTIEGEFVAPPCDLASEPEASTCATGN